ncbi:MAG: HAMP domain-containing histidine kinase [Lachnospiraceae bacterium]|nr:HAMP domain-containing histidine kinase [Lachnospiraceae bacterium]
MNFRLRLIISFALLISIAFGVGGTLLISSAFYSLLKEEQSAIINEYETLHNNLIMVNYFSSFDSDEKMNELIEQMSERNMAHWQAVSLEKSDGVILQKGDQNLLSYDLQVEDQGTYGYVLINEGEKRRLLLCSELETDNDILSLKASFDLSSAYINRDNQLRIFFVIYIVVVAVGILVAVVCANLLTKRLQKLTEAAREIAGGNLSMRTSLRTGDEFEQLSRDFDAMADQLEDNIKCLEEDVERKENFMGAVAHELKTPLTSIIGYADLIRQCNLEEDERMMAANYIYSEGQRLEKLSYKMLDLLLMDKDTFTLRETNIRTLMEQVYVATYPLAVKKKIELKVESDRVNVAIEPDLTKSLLYNLIDNAIKATPEEGRVKVSGIGIEGGCQFTVTDTGYGMEKEELSKITEAFYRVDKSRSRSQGGVGLGLTLCSRIVELHKGSMEFKSKPGQGSRVVVRLFGELQEGDA